MKRKHPRRSWNLILERLSRGETLQKAVRGENMPRHNTVIKRVRNDKEFAGRYMIAREIGYTIMADGIIDIADDGARDYGVDDKGREVVNKEHILRSRVRIDTRKWLLAKALPKIYGDRFALEASGPGGGPIPVAGLVGLVASLSPEQVRELMALPPEERQARLLALASGDKKPGMDE